MRFFGRWIEAFRYSLAAQTTGYRADDCASNGTNRAAQCTSGRPHCSATSNSAQTGTDRV